MMIDFSPTYTRLDFSPTQTAIAFTSIKTLITFPQTVELVFDNLNIPQFLTDQEAIATLAPQQAYQLIGNRLVKVTPASLFTNIWANFGKAFSYIRRAF